MLRCSTSFQPEVWDQIDWERALETYRWPLLAACAAPGNLIGAEPEFFVRHLLQRWAKRADALDPEAVADYVAQFRDPGVVAATCKDYRAGASIDREHDLADRQAGGKIACPLLIVSGRDYPASATPPAQVWRRWADRVEGLELDCGHFIAEEQPHACAKALLSFFRN